MFSQIEWTKYESNPVLTKGPENWDVLAIGQPTVLFEEGVLKMWYGGVGADGKARLCYATSTDGIEWIKHGVVMDVGGDGEWDRGWVDTPEILKYPGGYFLMYYGDTVQQPSEINSAMGAAYSTDGITWTKDPANPVFLKDNADQWDGTWIESPALFWDEDNDEFMMFYNGVNTSTWKVQIGLATSANGYEWTRYAGNPLITHGAMGSEDDMWCGTPAVIYRNDQFEMWYSGTHSGDFNGATFSFDNVSICYATSPDGFTWTKSVLNPLFDTFSEPHIPAADLGGPWAADVIYNDVTQTYMMWYEGHGGDDNYKISLATAPLDLTSINNSDLESGITVFPNPVYDILQINSKCILWQSQINIYNVSGQLVYKEDVNKELNLSIDLSDLPTGMYVLQVVSQFDVCESKVIISR